jgi:hypothetical protein
MVCEWSFNTGCAPYLIPPVVAPDSRRDTHAFIVLALVQLHTLRAYALHVRIIDFFACLLPL